jgi:hypothetical protein
VWNGSCESDPWGFNSEKIVKVPTNAHKMKKRSIRNVWMRRTNKYRREMKWFIIVF